MLSSSENSRNESEAWALLRQGIERRGQGQMDEAFAAFAAGQNLLPACPEFPAARASLYNDLGQFDEALPACDEALSLDAAHQDARFAKGFALFMLERLNEAQLVFDSLLTDNPAYPNAAWMRAGLLRRLQGEFAPEVLAAYDQALLTDPANRYIQIERADLLRAGGQYAQARDIYASLHTDSLCEDEDLRVEAAFKLGCVALVLQETDTARAALRAVLDVAPEYPDAQTMYALLALETA